jgi:hypothetical protein
MGISNFSAVISAMTGVYLNTARVSRLRHDMYSLLGDIDQDFRLFPRQSFATRDEFIQHLRMALVDPNSGQDIMTVSLSTIANNMQPSADCKQERWAQMNDAILASLYLGRTIVILSHDLTVAEAQQMHPRHDSQQFGRRINVFFPDGKIMVQIYLTIFVSFFLKNERMDENMELHHLHTFDIANDEESRHVNNPIVIYFDGVNHFEALRFVCLIDLKKIFSYYIFIIECS